MVHRIVFMEKNIQYSLKQHNKNNFKIKWKQNYLTICIIHTNEGIQLENYMFLGDS